LRESGNLDEATTRAVNQVADEAANLIGEFDEWFSNRQTWNNAALAAIAYWFEDEDLASRAIESPTGLLAHLLRGTGPAGVWGGWRDFARCLTPLYRQAAPVIPELFESYLHDAPIDPLPSPVSRTSLSWWALLFMEPQLPSDAAAWAPASILLDAQGLAILRTRDRYVSLECGPSGGGHGHPDRLHLTLHADGVHWLPDLGT